MDTDDDFTEIVRNETRQIITKLRKHSYCKEQVQQIAHDLKKIKSKIQVVAILASYSVREKRKQG